MRRIVMSLIAAASATVAVPSTAIAQGFVPRWTSNQPPIGPAPAHWSACSASILAPGGQPNNGPFLTYVSAAFDAGNAVAPAQQEAFKTFLIAKYAITTTDLHSYCAPVEDEAHAITAIRIWSDNGKVRGKVIDTGWKLAQR